MDHLDTNSNPRVDDSQICLKSISVMETSRAEYLPPYKKRGNTPYIWVDGETIDHEIGSLAGVQEKDDGARGRRYYLHYTSSRPSPSTK